MNCNTEKFLSNVTIYDPKNPSWSPTTEQMKASLACCDCGKDIKYESRFCCACSGNLCTKCVRYVGRSEFCDYDYGLYQMRESKKMDMEFDAAKKSVQQVSYKKDNDVFYVHQVYGPRRRDGLIMNPNVWQAKRNIETILKWKEEGTTSYYGKSLDWWIARIKVSIAPAEKQEEQKEHKECDSDCGCEDNW